MKINANTLLLVLVGVLVVMAGLQAFQLTVLAQALSNGVVAPAQSSVLSQLPTQVGGCG